VFERLRLILGDRINIGTLIGSNFPITQSDEVVTIRESIRPNVLTDRGVYGLESAKLGTPHPQPPTGSCSKAPGTLGLFSWAGLWTRLLDSE
jgi:hypothetical protein